MTVEGKVTVDIVFHQRHIEAIEQRQQRLLLVVVWAAPQRIAEVADNDTGPDVPLLAGVLDLVQVHARLRVAGDFHRT